MRVNLTKYRIRNLSLLFVALTWALTLVAAPISAFAATQTDTFTNAAQFNTGELNNLTIVGDGDNASLQLCEGGQYCMQYRREITIDNTGGTAMTGGAITIQLDTASLISANKMQSNCSDIRFFETAEIDESSAWFEDELSDGLVFMGCNTASTFIILTIPYLEANSTKTIWMQYGSLNTLDPLSTVSRSSINQSMATNPVPPATLEGDASWSGANQYAQLTSDDSGADDQDGRLQYINNPGAYFDISTEFWSGNGDSGGVYLYSGINEAYGQGDVDGYSFLYDERHDFIGVSHDGTMLAAVFCTGVDQVSGLTLDGAVITEDDIACGLDNSAWRTARVVRSGSNIKMYLDGNMVLEYEPNGEALPVADGPYMGWGAYTGYNDAYKQHNIRNVDLDITPPPLMAAQSTSVSAEEDNTDVYTNTGTWYGPWVELSSSEDRTGALGDGNPESVAISGHYSNLQEGSDYMGVGLDTRETEFDPSSSCSSDVNDASGVFSFTADDMSSCVNNWGRLYIEIVDNGSVLSLNDVVFTYSPDLFGAPSAPVNLQVSSEDGADIEVTWEEPEFTGNSTLYEYVFEYKFADSDWGNSIDEVTVNTLDELPVQITLPKLGVDYDFRVQTSNDYGNSPYATLNYQAAPADAQTRTISNPATACEDLQAINDHEEWRLDKIVLETDVDCSDTVNWNDGAGFMPIGYEWNESFSGEFDGQGHTITGLTINRPDTYDVGLFSWSDYGTFKNINIEDASIVGISGGVLMAALYDGYISDISTSGSMAVDEYSGGLIGYLENYSTSVSATNITTDVDIDAGGGCDIGGVAGEVYSYNMDLSDFHASGDITNASCETGGLFGYLYAAAKLTLSNSSATGNVSGSGNHIGGLIGIFDQSEDYPDAPFELGTTITNVYATGDVTAGQSLFVGGLMGNFKAYNEMPAALNKAYATGDIKIDGGEDAPFTGRIGGLIGGLTEGAVVTDVYATGDVNVQEGDTAEYQGSVGGLVGYMYGASLANAYASGSVFGKSYVGGLAGYVSGSQIENTFSVGSVTASDFDEEEPNAAGLVGWFEHEVGGEEVLFANNYYDQTTSGQNVCVNMYEVGDTTETLEETGCTYVTEPNHFVNKSTGTLFDEWDFANIWHSHTNGLPTFSSEPADDEDGISTEVESAGPNSGDANNDGQSDAGQANVASFSNAVTGQYAALAVDDSCALTDVGTEAETVLSRDNSFDYPLGLMNFTADCGQNGFTTTINQYFYNPPAGEFVLRKFVNGAYHTIEGASITRQIIGGVPVLVVSYQVTDGGPLDDDGVENGIIVDPAGPALLAGAAGGAGAPNTGLQTQNSVVPTLAFIVGLAGLSVALRRKAAPAKN